MFFLQLKERKRNLRCNKWCDGKKINKKKCMNGCILLCHISLKLQEFWVGKCEVMHVFWLNLRCNPLKKKFRDVIGAFYVDWLLDIGFFGVNVVI